VIDDTSASAAFIDKNAGLGKTVTFTGLTLTGADASNYTLASQPTATASITQRPATIIDVEADDRPYDTTTTATFDDSFATVPEKVTGDSLTINSAGVSASFDTKDAAPDKTVTFTGFILTGTDANNYSLDQPTATATITKLDVSITGVTATKVYNGDTTSAPGQFTGGTVNTAAGTEQLAVGLSAASGTYNSKDVADATSITTVSGITITTTDPATDVNNYNLAEQPTVSATITKATLTFTGSLDVPANVYDGTIPATPAVSDITVTDSTSFTGLVSEEGFTLTTTDITAVNAYDSSDGGKHELSYDGDPTLTPDSGTLLANYDFTKPYINGYITVPIKLEVTATSGQILALNKYFTNAYLVNWGDDATWTNMTVDITHNYTSTGTFTVTLSPTVYSEFRQWTFAGRVSSPLVPQTGTTATNVEVSYMPAMSYFMSSATATPWCFFYSFNDSGALTSLPANSFDTSAIITTSDEVFQFFNRSGDLTTLPEGSFDTSNITTVGNHFCYYFNHTGDLTSLPEGSFNTSNITTVGNGFFYHFNHSGDLTTLPEGSFAIPKITNAQISFFEGFNQFGALTSLPEGSFNTTAITTSGDYFFAYFNQSGDLTSLPESFAWPAAATATPAGTHNFSGAFNSSTTFSGRTAQQIINGRPAPSYDTNCFSSNQPGYDELDDNWKA
jgi:hypothetical protein